MSGIFGIVCFDEQTIKREDIQIMLHAAQNCASDAEDIWVDNGIALGHKMLWTTPESLHENQPLMSKNCNLVITADARIDNRDKLACELILPDRPMEEIGDSEFILAAYAKWGEECPKYLKGDFAFAILDKIQKKLFITRDRFGIKPFYFYIHNKTLYFSSYIDALMATSKKPFAVNNGSIKSFGKFATIKYEETMYDSIFRIPPAFCFVFNGSSLRKNRYWFPEKIKIDNSISFETAKNRVTFLLRNAVESRLRVYGDFACELSGGLDSTAISLLTKDITDRQFKTFSMRYQSYSCDEWKYTKEAISKLECKAVVLDVDQLDVAKKYHIYNSVQQNKHWSLYGSFMFNYALGGKMVENGVRVCLTGHGGDHVFTGNYDPILDYLKHFHFKLAMDELRYSKENLFRYIYRMIKKYTPNKIKSMIKKYLFGIKQLDVEIPENFTDYWNIPSIESDSVRSNLYAIVGRQHVTHSDNNHYRILENCQPIEFRHPFFDTELIEYLLTVPNHYKYREGIIKILLREALKDIYPPAIYERKDKAEFSEALLAQMSVLDMKKIWSNSQLIKNHLIDESLIEALLIQYQNSSIDAEGVGRFWRATALELWLMEI